MRHAIHLVPAVAGLVVGVLGCSVVVDADRNQCSTDADCAGRGGEFSSSVCVESLCQPSISWACLGAPAAPAVSEAQFQVSFLVRDSVTQRPKTGIGVRLCRKLDVECSDALSSLVAVDDQGNATFQVAAGFEGYARFEGADVLPGMYFFNPPVAGDTLNIPITLSSPNTAAALAALTGATLESGRGIVLLSVVDCTGSPASGIALSSSIEDGRAKTFYAQQGFPSAMATMTDVSGYGGVVNANPGTTTFSAILAESGQKLNEMTVLVQPGTQTMTTLVPNGS